jgi:DNA mismatch endonuclease (patch repair protein)
LRCRADVVFPRARIAVFIDGCFWHGCPSHGRTPRRNAQYWAAKINKNRARDARNNEVLTAAGWLVLRFWEHEDPQAAADEIAAAYRRRAAEPTATGTVAHVSRSSRMPRRS